MKTLTSIFLFFICVGCISDSQDTPFIHTAYFWFAENASDNAIAEFKSDIATLKKIPGVTKVYHGEPANTTRPIVERTYHYAVQIHLKDLQGHDAYQQHALHQALLKKHKLIFEKVMVTDFQ